MNRDRVCLADDSSFAQHRSPPGHPECPARLEAARRGFEAGMGGRAALRLVERDAEWGELVRVHTAAYLERLAGLSASGGGQLDADTFVTAHSWEVARRASGAALAVTDALIDDRADHGVALLRPPGHHARPDQGMGFCLLNHVAVAARHALSRGLKRVLIVDWDVHHGNGTEEVFESSSEVLYASLHESPQYPGTGAASDVGRGAGRGYTLNVPLSSGAGLAAYQAAFERLVLPVVHQFRPELTFVSAGYDAHARDPLGGMQLDAHAYAWMTRCLLRASSCPLSFLLEGGYDMIALEQSVAGTVAALLHAPPQLPAGRASELHEEQVRRACECQRPFWRLDAASEIGSIDGPRR